MLTLISDSPFHTAQVYPRWYIPLPVYDFLLLLEQLRQLLHSASANSCCCRKSNISFSTVCFNFHLYRGLRFCSHQCVLGGEMTSQVRWRLQQPQPMTRKQGIITYLLSGCNCNWGEVSIRPLMASVLAFTYHLILSLMIVTAITECKEIL